MTSLVFGKFRRRKQIALFLDKWILEVCLKLTSWYPYSWEMQRFGARDTDVSLGNRQLRIGREWGEKVLTLVSSFAY